MFLQVEESNSSYELKMYEESLEKLKACILEFMNISEAEQNFFNI